MTVAQLVLHELKELREEIHKLKKEQNHMIKAINDFAVGAQASLNSINASLTSIKGGLVATALAADDQATLDAVSANLAVAATLAASLVPTATPPTP